MLQHPSLWTELDLSNWQNPAPAFEVLKGTEGAREALRKVNLEFTVGIDDGNLETLSHFPLVTVNLNGCQKCAAWLAPQTLLNQPAENVLRQGILPMVNHAAYIQHD